MVLLQIFSPRFGGHLYLSLGQIAFYNVVAKNRTWIFAFSGLQLILAELVAILVLNVISPVIGGGQEEDSYK